MPFTMCVFCDMSWTEGNNSAITEHAAAAWYISKKKYQNKFFSVSQAGGRNWKREKKILNQYWNRLLENFLIKLQEDNKKYFMLMLRAPLVWLKLLMSIEKYKFISISEFNCRQIYGHWIGKNDYYYPQQFTQQYWVLGVWFLKLQSIILSFKISLLI